jgi:hypothetical protein
LTHPYKNGKHKEPTIEQRLASTLPPIEVYTIPCPRIRIPLLTDVRWPMQKKWMERYGESLYLKDPREAIIDIDNMRAFCYPEGKEALVKRLHKAGHMVIDMKDQRWVPLSRAI